MTLIEFGGPPAPPGTTAEVADCLAEIHGYLLARSTGSRPDVTPAAR
ncbi:hypothetical protein [Nakamurella lactea]|nr:hypothetical protein [Nakamurella lactea]